MPATATATASPAPDAETAHGKGKRRLHEGVFEVLACEILDGVLPAGSTLPGDSALVARFGVSRTVIREALQAMAGAGLINVRHGSGTYVNTRDDWDLLAPHLLQLIGRTGAISALIEDLLDIRRMFEVEAVTLAARRATVQDIALLESLVAEMQQTGTTDARHSELNLEFHSAIVQASHNRILRRLREQLRGVLSVMMNARERQADHAIHAVSVAMHHLIVESIKERRPDRAQAVMLAHLQGAERSLQRPTS